MIALFDASVPPEMIGDEDVDNGVGVSVGRMRFSEGAGTVPAASAARAEGGEDSFSAPAPALYKIYSNMGAIRLRTKNVGIP